MPGEGAEGAVGGVLELVLDSTAPRVERGYVLTVPRHTCTAIIDLLLGSVVLVLLLSFLFSSGIKTRT